MTISKLNLQRERLAVTADSQRDDPARGCFADHAPQLCATFDLASIHAEDDVVFFQPRLARRSILIDHGDFHTALILQL